MLSVIHVILRHLRGRRVLRVEAPPALAPLLQAFRQAADGFSGFIRGAAFNEPESSVIAAHLSDMANALVFALTAHGPAELDRLLLARAHPDL